MIRFTLDRLMFEKGRMKVPELQEKSGVNKNTLYAIYNNTCTRVDLSVINRLCNALGWHAGDIMIHEPDNG